MDLGTESQVGLSRDKQATQGTLCDPTLVEKGQVGVVWEVLEGRRFSFHSFGTDSLAGRVENSVGSEENREEGSFSCGCGCDLTSASHLREVWASPRGSCGWGVGGRCGFGTCCVSSTLLSAVPFSSQHMGSLVKVLCMCLCCYFMEDK